MFSKQKILIVDDMPVNIKILVEALRTDYDVYISKESKKAMQIAQEQGPDLILLDIMMPDIDGYTLCRMLKNDSRTQSIPIIFVTAKSCLDDELKGLELGAVDYITKPFQLSLVRARVRTQLDLKRKYDLLENLALVDGLTEIANRRRFNDAIELEWRRNMRSATPLSVIMMDIDCFKEYNDHYGHLAGDDCLKRVARTLKTSLRRAGDLVARYGGEEFVALLPNTHTEGAAQLAESIRINVADLQIPHCSSSVAAHITISLGVATVVPHCDSSPSDLVKTADTKLYLAKEGGRNQVVATDGGSPAAIKQPGATGQ